MTAPVRGSPVDFRQAPVMFFGVRRGKSQSDFEPNWIPLSEERGVELPLWFLSEGWLGADPEERNIGKLKMFYRTLRFYIWKFAMISWVVAGSLSGRHDLFVFVLHKGPSTAYSAIIIERYLSLLSLCGSMGVNVRLMVVGTAESDEEVQRLLEQRRLEPIVIRMEELRDLLAAREDLHFISAPPLRKPCRREEVLGSFRRMAMVVRSYLF